MQARELIGKMRRMAGAGLLLAAMMVCGGGFGPPARGATPEDQAFRVAFKLFQDSLYPEAETHFDDFLARYTNSTHRADAILFLARARLGQSNFDGAITLLQKNSADAGGLRLDYIFWIARARAASGDLKNAADGFAAAAKEVPLSPPRLDASYDEVEPSFDEAEAHARMGDWPGVIRLLQQTNGPFQLAIGMDAKSEFAARGRLLLGEALLREQRPDEGESVVLGLDPAALTRGDLRWQRQDLLCRLQLAEGRAGAALAASTNLLELALDPREQAASFFLQGRILEKLDRPADALAVYAKNLTDAQPPEIQREALARTIQWTLALNPLPQAIQALDTLIGRRPPQAPGQDLARVSLAEWCLKDTNLLDGALTNLNLVVSNFTNSPLLGRARLDRGWCDWLSSNYAAARVDFQEAAARLPLPQDQAIARFKLADAQFSLKDYAGAASNYALVLTNKTPEVTNSLFDLALYQIAESDIRRGDAEGAGAAVDKILRWYPESYFGIRGSLLMMGGDWNRKYDYDKARNVFNGLLEKSPHSPLLPEVEYAIARTYDYQGNWNQAISRYKEWIPRHAGDPLLPEVQFHLALACGKTGLTNDALAGFTNFAARFPSNALAPWALNWVADYFYNQKDFSMAEKNYQELFQKHPDAGDLAYQARFWAGKSALAGQENQDAYDYFLKLVNLTNAPPALVARGYFALGDIFFLQYQANQTISNLNQAIAALAKLTNGAPSSAIAVEALGRLGDYYMAWADNHDTNTYAIVKQMYGTIVHFPQGSVAPAARCQAEFGLGVVAEKELHPRQALEHYCNVVYDSADSDPYWIERAGESAARICEDGQNWRDALAVYKRILAAAPALRPALEKKMAAAQARLTAAGK